MIGLVVTMAEEEHQQENDSRQKIHHIRASW